MSNPKRIGIYSGSFDPVHKGHVAFALAAAKAAKLDEIYLAPEIKPRRRDHVAHIAHRISMLRLAIRPHSNLKVLELPDANFSANRTLPRLQKLFPDAKLVLLLGSDLFAHLPSWRNVDYLLNQMELVVGIRSDHSPDQVKQIAETLPVKFKALILINSELPDVSSGLVRHTVASNHSSSDILASVQTYIKKHWLYHDISKSKKSKVN